MPTAMSISRLASAASVSRRSAALSRPVISAMRRPAPFGERRHPLEMLAGEHFRRRHHRRLPSGLDHVGHRDERDDGLARADVALQEPDHPLRRPEIGADLLDRPALRAGQRERQRRLEAAPERPVGDMRPAGDRPHSRAHQKQRELVGEQFVIGEAGRGRAGRIDVLGRLRPVHAPSALRRSRAGSSRSSVSSPIHSGRRGKRFSAPSAARATVRWKRPSVRP